MKWEKIVDQSQFAPNKLMLAKKFHCMENIFDYDILQLYDWDEEGIFFNSMRYSNFEFDDDIKTIYEYCMPLSDVKWEKLVDVSQLALNKVIIVKSFNPGYGFGDFDFIRTDRFKGQLTNFQSYQCSVNYFDANIQPNYEYFMILDNVEQ